jgi:hypothetical protein
MINLNGLDRPAVSNRRKKKHKNKLIDLQFYCRRGSKILYQNVAMGLDAQLQEISIFSFELGAAI